MSTRKKIPGGEIEITPTERTRATRREAPFWDKHPLLSAFIALIAGLAMIAVFTPTGESGDAPEPSEDVSALATELDRLSEDVGLLAASIAEREREPTDTPEPTAKPTATACIAPTGVRCGEPEPTSVGPVATVTIGDYIGSESPCEEDEIWDYVTGECIH